MTKALYEEIGTVYAALMGACDALLRGDLATLHDAVTLASVALSSAKSNSCPVELTASLESQIMAFREMEVRL